MPERDPFDDFEPKSEDVERTIILPAPGGKRRVTGEAPPPRPAARPQTEELSVYGASHNPLVQSGSACFALVRRLASTLQHGDVDTLRERVLQMVREFAINARKSGASEEAAHAARYALCALIDETVLSTPWGSQSDWGGHTILGTLHDETSGGERFFQILGRMSENPARNVDLLEFLYLCLSLGFQGKYAVMDRGSAQLEQITHNLYRSIANQRGEGERELSPHWAGISDRRPRVARYVPLWVFPVATCAVAVLAYLGFSYSINLSSDDVFAKLNTLGREAVLLSEVRQTPPVAIPAEPREQSPAVYERIRTALADESKRGLVAVADEGTAVKIIVHNKGLFASGSATVAKDFRPLIQKIGLAIKDSPGSVLVTGHTDSIPIRTLRFPSNWHLSMARADAVTAVLAQSLGDKAALVSEGRADTEPLAPNDSAEGRERNRRIEIKVPVQ